MVTPNNEDGITCIKMILQSWKSCLSEKIYKNVDREQTKDCRSFVWVWTKYKFLTGGIFF
jgi:hypothetical protein